MKKALLIIVMVCLAFSGQAYAKVLYFDDLVDPNPETGPHYGPLGNYEGFTWGSQFYYFTDGIRDEIANGAVSGTNGAFNSGGQDDYVSLTSATVFNFEGAYFTSVDWNQQDVEIEGYGPGGVYYSTEISIDKTPDWHDINFNNINELYFYPENYMAMDNMTVSPEPVSTMLFLTGGAVLGLAGHRKRKFRAV